MFAILVMTWAAWGQVNAEKQRPSDLDGLGGALESELAGGFGNVDAFLFEGEGRVYWTRNPHHVLVFGNAAFASERAVLDGPAPARPLLAKVFQWENASQVYLGYGIDISRLWRIEGHGQLQHDRFLLLLHRRTLGLGARLALWDGDRGGGHLGGGWMSEVEVSSRRLITGEAPRRHRHRASTYVSTHAAFGSATELLATVYAQPALVQPSDVRVLAEVDLNVALGANLQAGLELELRYDSQPPQTRRGIPSLAHWNGSIDQTLAWEF